ncbi:hypothetical protein A2U01_0075685, partial [Trifolium medium]|nr:hypothetical protein [Trifolium medium]
AQMVEDEEDEHEECEAQGESNSEDGA